MTTDPIQTVSKDEPRVWSLMQILAAAYCAGPFAGLYLMSQNFETFGNLSRKKKTLHYGASLFILLFVVTLLLPNAWLEGIPRTLVPIIYSTSIQGIAQVFQQQDIKEHRKNGKKKHTFWKWLLHMLWLLPVQIACILILLFLYSVVVPG